MEEINMSTSLIQLLPNSIDEKPFDQRLKSDMEYIQSNLDLKAVSYTHLTLPTTPYV